MAEEKKQVKVPIMAEMAAQGKKPEYLFWVGCAGSFDDRYKKVTRDFVKILDHFRRYPSVNLQRKLFHDLIHSQVQPGLCVPQQ